MKFLSLLYKNIILYTIYVILYFMFSLNTCSYSVLPEWYVHNEPVCDDIKEVTMETNENELSNDKEVKKKPMLGYDAMTVWQRSGCCLYAGLEMGVGQ